MAGRVVQFVLREFKTMLHYAILGKDFVAFSLLRLGCESDSAAFVSVCEDRLFLRFSGLLRMISKLREKRRHIRLLKMRSTYQIGYFKTVITNSINFVHHT